MPGSDGLLLLPYLSGERTPHNDSNARGVFVGLSLAHGRAHLTRAVVEGVCFAMRDSLELMRQQGVSPSEVRAIGGGARSRMWLQTLANVFGLPLTTVQPAGGAAFGAAPPRGSRMRYVQQYPGRRAIMHQDWQCRGTGGEPDSGI